MFGRVVVEDGGRHVDAELVGDDVRRHHRRGREQLSEVDERAVGGERHPGPLLPGRAVDGGDIAVAGLIRRIETGKPAGLRRPGQHQVVAGDRLAVGIDRLVADDVVEYQRGAADHRDGAEVVVADDLAVGTVIVESRQHPGERLRPARRRTGDGVGVVGRQRAVDRVRDLACRASQHMTRRSRHKRVRPSPRRQSPASGPSSGLPPPGVPLTRGPSGPAAGWSDRPRTRCRLVRDRVLGSRRVRMRRRRPPARRPVSSSAVSADSADSLPATCAACSTRRVCVRTNSVRSRSVTSSGVAKKIDE